MLVIVLFLYLFVVISQNEGEFSVQEVTLEIRDGAVPFAVIFNGCYRASQTRQKIDRRLVYEQDGFEKSGWFKPKKAKNWMEIGALSWAGGEDAPANFSNFGKAEVDVFSPGVAIYSTVPDDKYQHLDGTSMAAPVTAGIAATLRAYFPELSAVQVKEIIMASAVPQTQKVKVPGTGELVSMKEISLTGGVVNAYRAVELAKKTQGKAKTKNRKFKLTPTEAPAANKVVVP